MVQIPSERVALVGNFDTIAVRVHFGACGRIRVQFVLIIILGIKFFQFFEGLLGRVNFHSLF